MSSTTWSSLLEDNLSFGAELSEEDLSSVVLMLRDKISSLQEERNSLADRFNLEVEKAKEQTKAQQEEQRLEFEKDRDTYMKKAGIDIQDYKQVISNKSTDIKILQEQIDKLQFQLE